MSRTLSVAELREALEEKACLTYVKQSGAFKTGQELPQWGEVFRNWSILLFGVCFICDFGERVVEQGDVVIASDINNPCRPVLRS